MDTVNHEIHVALKFKKRIPRKIMCSKSCGFVFTLEKYCSKLMIPVVHFQTVTFAFGIQTKLSTKLENVHGAHLLK